MTPLMETFFVKSYPYQGQFIEKKHNLNGDSFVRKDTLEGEAYIVCACPSTPPPLTPAPHHALLSLPLYAYGRNASKLAKSLIFLVSIQLVTLLVRL